MFHKLLIYSSDTYLINNTIDGHSSNGVYWSSNSYSDYTLEAFNNSVTNNGYGFYINNGYDYNTIAYNNSWNNSVKYF